MKKWLLLPTLAALLSGCASGIDKPPGIRGYIFTYTREPYTSDLKDTPVTTSTGRGKVIRVKEPFSGYGVSAEFMSNAIGDIAKKQGMTQVYFADMEEFNILGIWRERRLHVYGE